MFGEEDVYSERTYTTSVTCKSNVGDVFCIKNTEFFRKLKPNHDSWKIIVLMAMAKEKAVMERVKKIGRMIRENKQATMENMNSLFKGNLLVN